MVIEGPLLNAHLTAGREVISRRSAQVGAGLVAGALLLAVILAPGSPATGWDWFRLWLAAILGACTLLALRLFQRENETRGDHQRLLLIAGVLVVTSFALNLTFSVGTTAFYTLGLIVAGYLTLAERTPVSERAVGAIVAALVPFWVWSALDAWTPGLLVLLPLLLTGVIVDGHMRRAAAPDAGSDPLTPRGHRLAAWLGVLGCALAVALLSLLTSHALAIAALAGTGAVILIGLEAASPSPAEGSWRVSSVAIVDAAIAWIALCWLAGLS